MKKYKFFIMVPMANLDYVLDKIRERKIPIKKKRLRIMTNPYIGLSYVIQLTTTESEYEELLDELITI